MDLAALADALSAEEYTDVFLDELRTRLDAADLDLTKEQHHALRPILRDGSEAQRTLILAHAQTPSATFAADSAEISARTDAAAVAILATAQQPVYHALRVEARAALIRELGQ